MDNRCAVCQVDLGRRKLSQTIMSRMELDCPHCRNMIRLNIHPSEKVVVMINGAIIVALGVSAYWYESQTLTVSALVAAGIGAALLPLLEVTTLRDWPRYARIEPKAAP